MPEPTDSTGVRALAQVRCGSAESPGPAADRASPSARRPEASVPLVGRGGTT